MHSKPTKLNDEKQTFNEKSILNFFSYNFEVFKSINSAKAQSSERGLFSLLIVHLMFAMLRKLDSQQPGLLTDP